MTSTRTHNVHGISPLPRNIDDQNLDSGFLSFRAPVLSPDERSISPLIATRLHWTETSDSPIEIHEMRLYELPERGAW